MSPARFGVDAAELSLFRDSIRKFAAAEIAPHYMQWERDGMFPRDLWPRLGEMGFLCTDIAETYGGPGAPFIFAVAVVEEFSRLGYASVAAGVNVHSMICAHYLANHGVEAQKQEYLPRMASGECVAAIGMTEPGAGSDLQAMRTTARDDGSAWIVNGQKTFITNGQHCDLVICAVKTDPTARGSKGTSMLLMDCAAEGFERGRNLEKIGLHSADTSEMFFNSMRVPRTRLLGELNRGFDILMAELPRERLGVAAQAVAAAEGALAWTKAYTQERQVFGAPVARLQNTRFRIAEMTARTRMARAFLDECCESHLHGELDAVTAAMLKYTTTELQCEVADGCLQLFGGYGYMSEYPIGRAFVDARIQRIYAGTSEIMLEIISRAELGR